MQNVSYAIGLPLTPRSIQGLVRLSSWRRVYDDESTPTRISLISRFLNGRCGSAMTRPSAHSEHADTWVISLEAACSSWLSYSMRS